MIFCPLPGTPLITQGFGQNPADYAAFGFAGHEGIDFGIPEGTQVFAPHDGVATVKDEGTSGYGLSLTIDDGKRRSLLAHLSNCALITGQNVYQGDPVAKSGKSGNASGPHLHWTFKIIKGGVVQNKDNGFGGALDVSEMTRLWLDQDLHRNAQYSTEAQAYLAMTFPANQYLKRVV
mgnify:CR=1 FL=1